MQIVTFDTLDSKIQKKDDSIAVRIAFLLGKKVALAGSYSFELEDREKGKTTKRMLAHMPLKNKIELVEIYFKIHSIDEKCDFDKFRKLNKHFINTKNKSTAYIASYQKLERNFSKLYNTALDAYDQVIEQSGFFELAKLRDEQIVQTFVCESKKPEKPDKGSIKASSVLSLDFDLKDETKIFIISSNFFKEPFADTFKCVDAKDEKAGAVDTVYLELLLKLPNLNYLNAAELRLVRNAVQNKREEFGIKAVEWIDMCIGGRSFEERKSMLQTKVLPLAGELNKSIVAHPIIQHVEKAGHPDLALEVYIGEIPFQLLLDYYSHYKVIGEETLAQMKLLQEKEERFNKRWPILMFRSAVVKDNKTQELAGDENPSMLVPKKSISID